VLFRESRLARAPWRHFLTGPASAASQGRAISAQWPRVYRTIVACSKVRSFAQHQLRYDRASSRTFGTMQIRRGDFHGSYAEYDRFHAQQVRACACGYDRRWQRTVP